MKERKVVHAVFRKMQIIERLGVKEYKSTNIFGQIPVVHLTRIEKEKTPRLHIISYKINFMNTGTMSK